ncbi:MAG: lipopolysaccharide assembly protein LapA domain-containing protein, partial [Acidimicrobiia bacterium]|nr:lipopolysaccharide assembly protein LapA domain-containing protein [Acidimicrobiia bacterium]
DAAPSGDGTKPEVHTQFVGTGMFWGLVVGVILAIVVIGFAAQNTQSATVKTIVWEWSSPLFVVVLISLIMGIVLDELVGLQFRARRRRLLAEKVELRRLRGKS